MLDNYNKNNASENYFGQGFNTQEDLEAFLESVLYDYKLGKLQNFKIFNSGLQDLNVYVETKKGKFVVKICSDSSKTARSREILKEGLSVMKVIFDNNLPTPKLILIDGNELHVKEKKLVCVMTFFEGSDFFERPPQLKDKVELAKSLAKIHLVAPKVNKNNDSWATQYFLKEYSEKKKYLKDDESVLVKSVKKDFENLDFENFKLGTIHGDMHRQNVLKNSNSYCIIDFGCVDYTWQVIDLAVFIAFFCFEFDRNEKVNKEIVDLVVTAYEKVSKLNSQEKSALPILIKATFCAYLLGSTYEKMVNNDDAPQISMWHKLAKKGLAITRDW